MGFGGAAERTVQYDELGAQIGVSYTTVDVTVIERLFGDKAPTTDNKDTTNRKQGIYTVNI